MTASTSVSAALGNRTRPESGVAFFRDVLGPKARSTPLGVWFIRVADGVDVTRPVEAADGRRVFELHPTA